MPKRKMELLLDGLAGRAGRAYRPLAAWHKTGPSG